MLNSNFRSNIKKIKKIKIFLWVFTFIFKPFKHLLWYKIAYSWEEQFVNAGIYIVQLGLTGKIKKIKSRLFLIVFFFFTSFYKLQLNFIVRKLIRHFLWDKVAPWKLNFKDYSNMMILSMTIQLQMVAKT